MTSDPRAAYDELIRRFRELATLASCSAVLGWDEQTFMPAEGAGLRGEQMALLAGIHHQRAVDPMIGELLSLVEGSDLVSDPESDAAVNAREWRRAFERRSRLPRELVETLARTTTLAQQEWIGARRDSNFNRFRPWLDKILALKRDEAACLVELLPAAEGKEPTPYDALLDEYEPGARVAELQGLFEALRGELVGLVQTIGEASARKREGLRGFSGEGGSRKTFPVDRQRIFGEAVAAALGFDFRRGRLDVTAHPFCTGIGPGDVRITTRYDEHQFSEAFFGILHEVGHGLYEQGLPAEHFGTPLGEAVSLGVHESQSRLWENAVGRSPAFWSYWFPMARRVFHQALHDVTREEFLAAINQVAPSLIRVQADEVTYNLHIIIRFELEQELLSAALPTSELPSAWNRKYEQMLGIRPPDDAQGCLQDIHWSAGLVGYFPTYTLGNIYAAQLFAKAQSDLPELERSFSQGDYTPLREWLRDRVHRHGRRYRPAELIERATRSPIDHRPLLAALRSKYGELYGIEPSVPA
jgi:carboxypeptidase Taq